MKNEHAPVMRAHVAILVMGATVVFSHGVFSQDDELKARFFAEAPGAWDRLELAYASVEGEATVTEEGTGAAAGKVSTVKRHERFAYGKDRALIESAGDDGKSRVICVNDKYSFLIKRATKSGPFHIEYAGGEKQPAVEHVNAYIKIYTDLPFTSFPVKYRDMITDKSFRLRRITRSTIEGEEQVKVEFSYVFTGGEKPKAVSGKLNFAPAFDWALRESDMVVEGVTHHAEVDYVRTAGGVPRPTRVTSRSTGPDQTGRFGEKGASAGKLQTYLFDRWDFREVPARDFTLTAYGLPETIVTPPSGSTSWTGFALIGTGLLLVAGVLVHKTRFGRNRKD